MFRQMVVGSQKKLVDVVAKEGNLLSYAYLIQFKDYTGLTKSYRIMNIKYFGQQAARSQVP